MTSMICFHFSLDARQDYRHEVLLLAHRGYAQHHLVVFVKL